MSASNIEWTDETDNIFVIPTERGKHGWYCEKISPGCTHCYAETLNVNRFRGYGTGKPYQPKYKPEEYKVRWDLIEKWERMRKPKIHFPCSMTDIFLDLYSDFHLKLVFEAMRKAEKQFFIILTKRPERAIQLEEAGIIEWSDNMMFMVTAENQESYNNRIMSLLVSDAKNKGLSIEPMLEMIDLSGYLSQTVLTIQGEYTDEKISEIKEMFSQYTKTVAAKPILLSDTDCKVQTLKSCKDIDWIIVGGESGKKARPMHPDWVRYIYNQCKEASVPFFFKQWGEYCDPDQTDFEFNDRDTGGEALSGTLYKVGKKKAGHLLDGKEVREYPECIINHFRKI